jgi:hypothetical protein
MVGLSFPTPEMISPNSANSIKHQLSNHIRVIDILSIFTALTHLNNYLCKNINFCI